MSEIQAETMTNVVGYFNPQKHSIYIEVSEISMKATLGPNVYIRDRDGNFINDPVFEPYCHQKGLAKATSKAPVPIRYVPRQIKSERPVASVTQATGFVREPGGRTVPTFPRQEADAREVPANKRSHTGMSIETAKKYGFVGKQRLLPEDYGAEETSGRPVDGNKLPPIKYSLEAPTKIKAATDLPPGIEEAANDLPPEEQQKRRQLQMSIKQASQSQPAENFDPSRMRPGTAPVAKLPPPNLDSAPIAPPVAPPPPATKPAKRTPTRRVAAPVKAAQATAPIPVAPIPVEPVPVTPIPAAPIAPVIETAVAKGSGILEPMDGVEMPPPNLDPPPADAATGRRFICAADGKPFRFRSELERHVRRNFPNSYETLMEPYPA